MVHEPDDLICSVHEEQAVPNKRFQKHALASNITILVVICQKNLIVSLLSTKQLRSRFLLKSFVAYRLKYADLGFRSSLHFCRLNTSAGKAIVNDNTGAMASLQPMNS